MKVFIATSTKFPEPSAVTTHISLVAKIFLAQGHDVHVYSRGMTQEGGFEGIPFTSFRGKGNKLSLLWHYLFSFKKKFLKALQEHKPDVVLLYAIPLGLSKKLVKISKKGQFLLMNDAVEWYSKEEFKPFTSGMVEYYVHEYRMRKLFPGNVAIIAISRYLEDYFKSVGNDCTYLPAVCDTTIVSCAKNTDKEKTIIVYAGSPAKKDLFEPIVKAISELEQAERARLELHIIGSTPASIAANADVPVQFIEQLGDCIKFVPRMPHSEVLKYLGKADFTILIRPSHMRYAKAGFPTKVPESLSTGTPVICNYSSDLELYLEDGINALIADSHRTEDVKKAIQKALALNAEQRESMYSAARKTAEEKFDYRLYVTQVNDFAKQVYEKKVTQQ